MHHKKSPAVCGRGLCPLCSTEEQDEDILFISAKYLTCFFQKITRPGPMMVTGLARGWVIYVEKCLSSYIATLLNPDETVTSGVKGTQGKLRALGGGESLTTLEDNLTLDR